MTTTRDSSEPKLRYAPAAYDFMSEALHYTQQALGRAGSESSDDEDAHISGQELLHGIRRLGQKRFGLLAKTVFEQWGIHETGDFGRIVFELIERGDMRKTEDDQLSDFCDIYSFQTAFDDEYEIDVSNAFRS